MWKDNILSIKCRKPAHSSSVENTFIRRQNPIFSNFFAYWKYLDALWIYRLAAKIQEAEVSAQQKLRAAKFPTENYRRRILPQRNYWPRCIHIKLK